MPTETPVVSPETDFLNGFWGKVAMLIFLTLGLKAVFWITFVLLATVAVAALFVPIHWAWILAALILVILSAASNLARMYSDREEEEWESGNYD